MGPFPVLPPSLDAKNPAMRNEIIGATMTLAKDAQEAGRLYESVHTLAAILSEQDIPLMVADGGSPDTFIQKIHGLPNVIVSVRSNTDPVGLVPQIKRALAKARERHPSFVFYTEPDKQWFFEQHLRPFLRYGADHPRAGLIFAARDAESFATFPFGQQRAEAALNQLYGGWFEHPGDFAYGPFHMNSELLPYINKIPDDLGWGWRIFMLAVAHKKQYPIISYTGYLPCPTPEEDREVDRIYRLQQLAQNVRGLALGMKCCQEEATGGASHLHGTACAEPSARPCDHREEDP